MYSKEYYRYVYKSVTIPRVDARPRMILHFAGAYGVALGLILLLVFRFHGQAPPRYGDLFLPGVALICARYSWRSAALLFALSYSALLAAVLPLPPEKELGAVVFAGTGVMMICFVELAKRPRRGDR